jgi:hydroxypyruvate reductase
VIRPGAAESAGSWLRELFALGVARCSAGTTLPALLPTGAVRRTLVLGAGKAAAAMAAVAAARLPGEVSGCVVTRVGHGSTASTGSIRVIEASHPVPDERGRAAALDILALAGTARAGDRVIFLISGGGSSLLCLPCDGITLETKRAITAYLLKSGAPISDINQVRKSLSKVKGGRLADAASAAELHTFLISDVVGDDPTLVASGPSIYSPPDPDSALRILRTHGYPVDAALRAAMLANAHVRPSPHPVHVLATNDDALQAVAAACAGRGFEPVVLSGLEGMAREVGLAHASQALAYAASGRRIALISGGELTVKVRNDRGRGGPNLEYLAALALRLDGAPGIDALACDSDGIDGSEDNAGGLVSRTTLERARALGVDAVSLLEANDTYTLFAALGDLVITGPTLTNVNDIRIILIGTDH